jgi:CDP-diacylglycerol--serine O-phosphatidyltransferase
MRRIAALPSLVTLGNLVCGFTAIGVLSQPGEPVGPFPDGITACASFIMLGMLFDMLDGKLARMARVTSDFGGQLDSLSDVVTFGVAPGMLIVRVSAFSWELTWLMAVLYVVCVALRLARFNVEHSRRAVVDEDYFKGLPSPAGAGLVASLVLFDGHLMDMYGVKTSLFHVNMVLPIIGLAAGVLMVSRVRYPHLMSWIFKGKKQFADLVRLVFVCASIAYKPKLAFFVLFLAYAVSGIVQTIRFLAAAKFRKESLVETAETEEVG